MEHSEGNSHCGMENETRRVELYFQNGTLNTAGGTLIVEWNREHGRWNSHSGTKHGIWRMEL